MAKYSIVARRIWDDARFRELSSAAPNGQTLFLRLLLAPELAPIPGCIRIRNVALAEELGWPVADLVRCFAELEGVPETVPETVPGGLFEPTFAEGETGVPAKVEGGSAKVRLPMAKADWKAGFVWLPSAIRHNAPPNPNVVTSWAEPWEELPECDLKDQAYWVLHDAIVNRGPGFARAFAIAIPQPGPRKPSSFANRPRNGSPNVPRNGSGNPMPNHEHEHEHDNEHDHEGEIARAAKVTTRPLPKKDSAAKAFRISEDWQPDHGFEEWGRRHLNVKLREDDVARCAETFRDHWIENRTKAAAKTARGWRAAFRKWLRNERRFHPELAEAALFGDEEHFHTTPKGFVWDDPRTDEQQTSLLS